MKLCHCYRIVLIIVALGLGSCGAMNTLPKSSTDLATTKPKEAKLELDNLSFQQVDRQGQPLWKFWAEQGIYTPDKKKVKVTNLSGDFYQDGQVILHVTAKLGEVEQEGEKVFLRGDVVTTETRNSLVLIGQEVEWQPRADLLIIRDRVQANHQKFQVNANEGRYLSRKQQLNVTGKITAFSSNPRLAMQTEQLTWLVKEQRVIGNQPTRLQRYQDNKVTTQVTTDRFTTALDQKIINLRGKVQLDSIKPILQVNGDSFAWQVDRELIIADRPLTIVDRQAAVTFNANAGNLDLKGSIATLSGQARGVATRNQANLSADRLVWEITSQQLIGTGNVVYQQIDPLIKFTGSRGVGKLQDQSVVISGGKQQVQTEFVPN